MKDQYCGKNEPGKKMRSLGHRGLRYDFLRKEIWTVPLIVGWDGLGWVGLKSLLGGFIEHCFAMLINVKVKQLH